MLCKVVPMMEEALTAHLLQSTMQALELYGIYLGKECGLDMVLKSGGGADSTRAGAGCGNCPTLCPRSWLEQQAVAGLLHVDASVASADARPYWLPAEHEKCSGGRKSPRPPRSARTDGGRHRGRPSKHVVAAYRTGEGVAYPHFGAAFRKGQAGINRPGVSHRSRHVLDPPLRPISMPRWRPRACAWPTWGVAPGGPPSRWQPHSRTPMSSDRRRLKRRCVTPGVCCRARCACARLPKLATRLRWRRKVRSISGAAPRSAP